MDGVFMRKIIALAGIGLFLWGLIWFAGILGNRNTLREDIIRLHVVAESDSREDQAIKLLVRDAVTGYLGDQMRNLDSKEQAEGFLKANLAEVEAVANMVLRENGCEERARVTLKEEIFDTRHYDTFSLPAGVYSSLRITIGSGEGKNWWCVVFPTLCLPAAGAGFEDVAAGAGFPEELTLALEGQEGYELRFWLLDALGKLDGYFFRE